MIKNCNCAQRNWRWQNYIKRTNKKRISGSRKEPDEVEKLEDTEEEVNDDFENIYKGQISKSGVAVLPSKRTRKRPIKKQL